MRRNRDYEPCHSCDNKELLSEQGTTVKIDFQGAAAAVSRNATLKTLEDQPDVVERMVVDAMADYEIPDELGVALRGCTFNRMSRECGYCYINGAPILNQPANESYL